MTEVAPPPHAPDRLLAAIEQKAAPVCVGLDPVLEKLPANLRPTSPDAAVQAIDAFSKGVLDAIHQHIPCVKFQSACYERYGWQGVRALQNGISYARQLNLQIILDAKRGDIGISAQHYAAAAFDGPSKADWLTINAYLGSDGIEPFLQKNCGAFALVRTSNPGGDALQTRPLTTGQTVADAVAAIVAEVGSKHVGQRGYSSLGAVVGATKPADAERLRQAMPQQLFLVPGFGAQGGSVADILPCFVDGQGAIVTASRSIIYAFDPSDTHWQNAVNNAAAKFADQIGAAVRLR